MKALLLVLAVLMNDGKIKTYASFVAVCPTEQEVNEMMNPRKERGEILAWGGRCGPIDIPTRL